MCLIKLYLSPNIFNILTYRNFQNAFSVECTEKSFSWPSLITCCMFSWVLGGLFGALILFRSSRKTMQVWHGILQRAALYVVVISFASSMSARKTEIQAANIISRPLIPKYSASSFSNKGRSIIAKHL